MKYDWDKLGGLSDFLLADAQHNSVSRTAFFERFTRGLQRKTSICVDPQVRKLVS